MAYIGQPKEEKNKKALEEIEIKFEELSFDLQYVAEKCGIETVLILLKNMQGMEIYIPRISKFRNYNKRYLKSNTGKNLKQIASELGVSENYLRNLKYELLYEE